MKHIAVIIAATSVALVACGPSEAEIAEQKRKAYEDSLATVASMERRVDVDAAASQLEWKGTMLGIKAHYGTVALADAKLVVKGPSVVAGGFVVDLNTITPKDTLYAPDESNQGTRAQLVGHLHSPDFFDVANHPTATFDITRQEGNTLYGNLTVRGVTHEEKVTDVVVNEENGQVTATGTLTFDRQKYGVAWSSGVKDAVLSDDIEVKVTIVGTIANEA